jgi:hypothetical protein
LKRLTQKVVAAECCALCNTTLGPDHRHLVEPHSRRIECACTACALLFENQSGRYRLTARDPVQLRDFVLDSMQWDALGVPINLAFFFENSVLGRVVALYPSPGGATESLLPLSAWNEIAASNPRLQRMQPDVEALLVNRNQDPPLYFIAPIDRCYELVGTIRRHWSGFTGGDEVWTKIDQFFEDLRSSSIADAANA